MVRKQILVTEFVDRRIRRLARERDLSQSALIAEAVLRLPDAVEQVERILSYAGSISGDADGALSEQVDEALYGV